MSVELPVILSSARSLAAPAACRRLPRLARPARTRQAPCARRSRHAGNRADPDSSFIGEPLPPSSPPACIAPAGRVANSFEQQAHDIDSSARVIEHAGAVGRQVLVRIAAGQHVDVAAAEQAVGLDLRGGIDRQRDVLADVHLHFGLAASSGSTSTRRDRADLHAGDTNVRSRRHAIGAAELGHQRVAVAGRRAGLLRQREDEEEARHRQRRPGRPAFRTAIHASGFPGLIIAGALRALAALGQRALAGGRRRACR